MPMTRISSDRRLKIKDGEPLLLGYDFYNGDHERLGRVSDLIVETELMKVPFAIVDLEVLNRRVIVPMWEVRIDPDGQRLICEGCDQQRIEYFTVVAGDELPGDLSFRIRAAFIPGTPKDEEVPALPEGHPGTQIAPDARILEQGPRGARVEKVDHVRLVNIDPPSDLNVMNF